jgi:hypothetical protein
VPGVQLVVGEALAVQIFIELWLLLDVVEIYCYRIG